jgi:cobalt-precorrin 5A hydrolase/precorrin-3B C17-methyltransferase
MTQSPAIIILSEAALPMARRIARATGGEIHALSHRVGVDVDVRFDEAALHFGRLFADGRPIVALMAAGAVIRLLAPHLNDKRAEPAVIAVAENGSAVVPLLGGHHGANDLAREIAGLVDGFAAVTTAGDVRFGIALDAPPEGWVLANPEDAKAGDGGLWSGRAGTVLQGEAAWLSESGLPVVDDGDVTLIADEQGCFAARKLGCSITQKSRVLGIGCERGAGWRCSAGRWR